VLHARGLFVFLSAKELPHMKRLSLIKFAPIATLLIAVLIGVGTLVRAIGPFPIGLTVFSTPNNNPVGLDYYEPTNELLLSVNYFSGLPNNLNLLSGAGAHTPFGKDPGQPGVCGPGQTAGCLKGQTDELKVATVRASACQGGFSVGDTFAGNGVPGQLLLVRGGMVAANPWVTLLDPATGPEKAHIRGSIYQDRHCAFGGDLIVVTGNSQPIFQVDNHGWMGKVWRVACGPVAGCSAPVVTLVADLQKHLEGVVTVPNDPARYGPIAGRILVGDEDRTFGPHGKCGRLFAIRSATDIFTISAPDALSPDCVTSQNDVISYAGLPHYNATSPIHPEDLDWIPAPSPNPAVFGDGRFFGIDYAGARVLTAPLSDFTSAGLCGDLLMTREYPNDGFFPGTSGLSTLRWNTNTQQFDVIHLTTPGGTTASQWEHVTFRGGADCRPGCTGRIGDKVWKDIDGNGQQNVGNGSEPGIPGVTVTLTMPAAPGWSLTTTTDANGNYLFTGLCAGTYVVTVTPPPGDVLTIPFATDPTNDSNSNPATVVLGTDSTIDLTIDFGFKGFASISDRVWTDVNCNGIQDPGEPGLNGVIVHIKGGLGNPGGVDITSAYITINKPPTGDGFYIFPFLNPGDYTVTAEIPAGYTVSPTKIGGAAVDSNGTQLGSIVWDSVPIPYPGEGTTRPRSTSGSARLLRA
jgi:hypothetical protein